MSSYYIMLQIVYRFENEWSLMQDALNTIELVLGKLNTLIAITFLVVFQRELFTLIDYNITISRQSVK